MAQKLVSVILVLLLVVLHGQLWLGRGSMSSVASLRVQLNAQLAANEQAREANDRLAAEVQDLQTGMEIIEERARMELGMVKPNEIYVQLPQ